MKALPVAAALLVLAAAGTAHAARKAVPVPDAFDGQWSIVATTESGSCDRVHRYGVRIDRGEANAAGGFDVDGRVTANGSVRATISNGLGSAIVVGRLTRKGSGSGTWTTDGAVQCRGRWSAARGA